MKKIAISTSVTNRESESFKKYLREVSDIKKITPLEEKDIIDRLLKGDKSAFEDLKTKHLRFVITVAKKYATQSILLEDLVNEGNIGLIMAVNRYDPTTGFKFISYAVWWIQKAILDYLNRYGKIIRLPSNKVNGLNRLEKKVSDLEQKFGRAVDISEVIGIYGNGSNEGDDYNKLNDLTSFSISSLDKEINVGDEGSQTTMGNLLMDEDGAESDYLLYENDVKTQITKLLDTLKPRDRQIMIALFGLDGKVPRNLVEVGAELTPPLTHERVRQIKAKTLLLLKNKLRNSSLYEAI